MHPSELTKSKMLHDPMICQVMRADGISLPAFAMFLQQAAHRQLETKSSSRSARDHDLAQPLPTDSALDCDKHMTHHLE